MAQALALYLHADKVLSTVAMDADGREYWEAVKKTAYSQVFFG
jgi:hypothetical protein